MKIILRREMFGGDGTTYVFLTVYAFKRVLKIEYGRDRREHDALYHRQWSIFGG